MRIRPGKIPLAPALKSPGGARVRAPRISATLSRLHSSYSAEIGRRGVLKRGDEDRTSSGPFGVTKRDCVASGSTGPVFGEKRVDVLWPSLGGQFGLGDVGFFISRR